MVKWFLGLEVRLLPLMEIVIAFSVTMFTIIVIYCCYLYYYCSCYYQQYIRRTEAQRGALLTWGLTKMHSSDGKDFRRWIFVGYPKLIHALLRFGFVHNHCLWCRESTECGWTCAQILFMFKPICTVNESNWEKHRPGKLYIDGPLILETSCEVWNSPRRWACGEQK